MTVKYLPESFRFKSPVLENVVITSVDEFWDGPLCGMCEVNGVELYYQYVVFDMWRRYGPRDSDRLWCIFAAYMPEEREDSEFGITSQTDAVGIFWKYSYKDGEDAAYLLRKKIMEPA